MKLEGSGRKVMTKRDTANSSGNKQGGCSDWDSIEGRPKHQPEKSVRCIIITSGSGNSPGAMAGTRKAKHSHLFFREPGLARDLERPMRKDAYSILAKRHLLLQAKYLRMKEELEKFLRKKSGYGELRDLMKEISSELSAWGNDFENHELKGKEDS